jgi:hypothetical protein
VDTNGYLDYCRLVVCASVNEAFYLNLLGLKRTNGDVYPVTTSAGTVLQNQNPAPGDVDVLVSSSVYLEIFDEEWGLDPATVVLYAEGTKIWENGANIPASGYTVTPATLDLYTTAYTAVRDTDFPQFTVIPIRVVASDTVGHAIDESYSFTTEVLSFPYFDNVVPAGGDVDVSPTAAVTLDAQDLVFPIEAADTLIEIDGVTAWASGMAQPGFSGTATPVGNGYHYEILPDVPFTSYAVVSVYVYAKNSVGNASDTTYTFQIADVIAPRLENLVPAIGATGVGVWDPFSFDLLDDDTGVDPALTDIYANGVLAWTAGAAQAGFTGTVAPVAGGYHYALTRTASWHTSTTTLIRVVAYDQATVPNLLDTTYPFDVVVTIPPAISVITPPNGAQDVLITTHLLLRVVSANFNLDPALVSILVDNVLVYAAEVPLAGYTCTRTPITGGYSYDLTPPTAFTYGATVDLFVYAEDYSNAHSTSHTHFILQLSPLCFTGPLNAFETLLLDPFPAGMRALDKLRLFLLTAFVDQNTTTAARCIFLQGQKCDLTVTLRDLVPTPTPNERATLLCKRRPLLVIIEEFPGSPGWLLEQCLNELRAVGLPAAHYKMTRAYMTDATDPQLITLGCFLVLLGKALVP